MTRPCAISTLGEVCEWITQGPNPKYDKSGHDDFRVLKTKDLYDDIIHYDSADKISRNVFSQHLRTELKTGDVLIAIVGQGSINKCNVFEARVGTRFIFTRALGLLRPNKRYLDPYFLKYFLQSSAGKELIDSGIAGTSGQQIVTTTHLKSLQIPVPPLPEQQRIVGILDEAFDGLTTATANAEQNLRNARALFESHLQSVFTQRGKRWEETTIGECIRFIDYRGKTPVKTANGIRLITAKNVKMGYLQETPMEFIASASYRSWMTRGIPEKDDVLFTTEAPLANVAQLDTDEKVAFAQRIIIMQPEKTKLDKAFLKYLLLSAPVQRSIRAEGTGATVQGIKASLLKLIQISFPKALTEQELIVKKLDSLSEETQRLESIYQQKLAALDELKKSLLHQAFTGQL